MGLLILNNLNQSKNQTIKSIFRGKSSKYSLAAFNFKQTLFSCKSIFISRALRASSLCSAFEYGISTMVMATHHLFSDLFSTFYPLLNVEMGFALNVVDFRIEWQQWPLYYTNTQTAATITTTHRTHKRSRTLKYLFQKWKCLRLVYQLQCRQMIGRL